MDGEILNDFLIEAQEILDQLGEQLIALEGEPDDRGLLDAVFRSFHTIKGGAGFLDLEPLVAVSHAAEEVFDGLRAGRARIDAALMDTMLETLDVIHGQFDALRAGTTPAPAPQALLDALAALAGTRARGAGAARGHAAAPFDAGAFDALGRPARIGSGASARDDAFIAEDEFEALLDTLHGRGRFGARPEASVGRRESGPAGESAPAARDPHPAGRPPDPFITEDEFEALLDRLHGPGRFGRRSEAAAAPPGDAAQSAIGAEPLSEGRSPKAAAAESTVRVDTVTLDRMVNMVGELVLIRNRLTNLNDLIANAEMARTVASLDLLTSNLQAVAMRTRMQPIKKIFGRFPRVVRDLARSLGKEARLELAGEETELDKNLVEALADPLVHLVRNALDHGIEAPAERVEAGKPRAGQLLLKAAQKGDRIVLTIRDDGRGIDAEALKRTAIEAGRLDAESARRLSDRECFEFIFMPGLSTKQEISDLSGRGVGMDVVKTRINQLNGVIEIDSEPGTGTTIMVTLPLTLAIVPTLMIVLSGRPFALPLVNVKEVIDFEPAAVHALEGQRLLRVRGSALPFYDLGAWLAGSDARTPPERGHVVIVKAGSQAIALLVDALVGQEEVVIKPLGRFLKDTTRGLAGATVTGDGQIALVLDLPDLVSVHAERTAA